VTLEEQLVAARAEADDLAARCQRYLAEREEANARAAAAERERDGDAAVIKAMREALKWVIESDETERDEHGMCEGECCESPMIAACRSAVAIDAARRATTGDAKPAPTCDARTFYGSDNIGIDCKLPVGHDGSHRDGGLSWKVSRGRR
jgi:hypothetical protein